MQYRAKFEGASKCHLIDEYNEMPRGQENKEKVEKVVDKVMKKEVAIDHEKPKEMWKEEMIRKIEKELVNTHVPQVTYPQRLKEANHDFVFSKFINIMRFFKVNIPFVDTIL